MEGDQDKDAPDALKEIPKLVGGCNHSLSQQPWDCDITTIARGPAECNELLRRGWKIFSVSYVDEVRRRSRPGVQEARQVMAYYTLGRRFNTEDEKGRAALQVEAADAADAASAPPPEPEPPDDPADEEKADPPQPAPAEKTPVAGRPQRKAGPAREGSTRAPGAMGPLKTEGIR